MYPVSNAYKSAIFDDERVTRITGTITLKNGTIIAITNESIAEAPSISNQCVNDTELKLGQAYQAQLDIGIYSDIDRYKIYGATIVLNHGVLVSEDPETWEDVPCGKYIVKECIRTSNDILKITALDEMDKLNKKFEGGIQIAGEPYDILSVISVYTNMPLAQTKSQIRALPNGTKTGFQMREKYRSSTWRDVLGDIAACLAGNAILDREGKIYIQTFSTAVTFTLPADSRTRESISDYEVVYTSASCMRRKDLMSVGTGTGQDISLDANDFIQKNSWAWAEGVLQTILDTISPLRYTPSDISWYGDPALDLGDLIQATGSAASTSTLIPIQKHKWTWRGEHQIVSVGKNPYLGETQSLTDKQISKLAEESDVGKIAYVEFMNPRQYEIESGTEDFEIASLFFSVYEDCGVEEWTEIKLKTFGETKIKLHYWFDGEELTEYEVEDLFTAGQVRSYFSGETLVIATGELGDEGATQTVNYHWHLPQVPSGSFHTWSMTMDVLSGKVIVEAGDLHCILWAQGMLGEGAFIGLIEAQDNIPFLDFASIELFGSMSDTATVTEE